MDHPPLIPQRGPQVPLLRQILNGLGCILILPLYYYLTAATRHPLTLDLLLTILAAEYNRFTNERRRRNFYQHDAADPEKPRVPAGPDCMAAVVGYREDPGLFARALNSYRAAEGCRFMLVGIDGDEAADMEMVRVFQSIYPAAPTIHLDEPFGDLAMRTFDKLATADLHSSPVETYQLASIAHCCELARTILADHGIAPGPGASAQLCLFQPHQSKKAIMFTSFIFSLVIADAWGLEYLWSSDSDTLVSPLSLRRTVETIAGDPTVGGGSSGLLVHNAGDSTVAQLGSIVYWCELYLTRSVATSAGTSDCQSGPSTAFRIAALPGILYPWYTQTVLGHRMVVNEDRHLTTNLLLRGWTVTYVSDTLTATDTPTNLRKWILQQVRWSRSGHIESLQSPRLYLLTNPLFFWAAIKREAGPLLGMGYILYYLLTGASLAYFSWTDLGVRLLYTIIYNVFRNPDRGVRRLVLWVGLLPALLFYNVPLPVVHFWSAVTVMEDGWGTAMRSPVQGVGVVPDVNNDLGVGKARKGSVSVSASASGVGATAKAGMWKRWNELGFFVVWMGVVAGVAARIMAGHLGYEVLQTERAVWGAVLAGFAGTFYGLVVRE